MALRRGFKSEANSLALEFRQELSLEPHAPLCPWQLADHLEIPIINISKLNGKTLSHIRYFQGNGCQFSAASIPLDTGGRGIILNDFHHPSRQSSSIAHEISHIVLRHKTSEIIHADGTRKFNSVIEEEASNLGAILQIPNEAALHILENNIPTRTACSQYKVSQPLLEWRLRISGATKIIERRKKRGLAHA